MDRGHFAFMDRGHFAPPKLWIEAILLFMNPVILNPPAPLPAERLTARQLSPIVRLTKTTLPLTLTNRSLTLTAC